MSSLHAEAEQAAHQALAAYAIAPTAISPLTAGLINTTWEVTTPSSTRFVLQRLHPTFPPEVNLNLECVTRHLADKGLPTPRLCATPDGDWWVMQGSAVWRLLTFMPGHSFATLPDLAHAHTAGRLLGAFHAALADFTAPLPYSRAPVHEPARHQAALQDALARHTDHRWARAVGTLATEATDRLATLPAVAMTPRRLIHGDPKLSNLRFDTQTTSGCLVDLDTLVRAPLAYELGDALRSWCNPHAEDAAETRVELSILEAALTGYAQATRHYLLPEEASSIVTATEAVYLELAMRFAADVLHEAYFGWDPARFATRGDHNLQRARNQLACARLLAAQRPAAEQIVRRLFA